MQAAPHYYLLAFNIIIVIIIIIPTKNCIYAETWTSFVLPSY